MGNQFWRRALGLCLLGGAPHRQCLCLGQQIGHQHVVMRSPRVVAGPHEPDQVAGHRPGALVEVLEEGVLAVGARRSPHHTSGRDPHR